MRKTKLLWVLLVIFLCAVALPGCAEKEEEPQPDAAEEETGNDDKYIVGFSVIDMENPYFITLETAVRESLEKDGHTLITKDPGTDSDLQIDQIQEMIDEGIDALILTPVDWEKITPILRVLNDSRIKIINVDAQVKDMEYVNAYIGSDNFSAGYICGQDLIEKCPEGGEIIILECPTQNSINERISGFEQALIDADYNYELVGRADTGGEFEQALDATVSLLERYPDAVAIMCGNDQLAVGAKTAVNVAKIEDILIYGVDGSPDIKKELVKEDNQIAGTAAQSPANMGHKAVEIALQILNGEDYPKESYEEVFMINQDNVLQYGTDGWQ